MGRIHWKRAGVDNKIEVKIGPALKTLERLESGAAGLFDLAFVDADKEAYDTYYERTLRLVRPGGLIVFDNIFRLGRVAHPEETYPDPGPVRKPNAKNARHERGHRIILPIGTGITSARRRHRPCT